MALSGQMSVTVVGADVGDDDSGLLVEICGGVAPLGA